MKRGIWIFAILLTAITAPSRAAETPWERIRRLEGSINRASERGDFARVQSLRLELAQHTAGIGEYALAARQYELLLASRPRKFERVRYFIELGRMRDALQDY